MEVKTLLAKDLPVEKRSLHCPPLAELTDVLSKGLTSTFVDVRCEVVDCPNLTLPPFHLASEGFGGSTSIVDVGGPPYLLPNVNREKLYSLSSLGEACGGLESSFVVGAGAGPWPYAKTNCEMVANVKVTKGQASNGTRIVKMLDVEQENFTVEVLPNSETRFALLGNFYVSEGRPGKVLKINCKKRKGDDNFITAIRNVLQNKYGSQPVALGGVFLLNSGKVKQHIMPDFCSKPINTEVDLNNWLFFHDMSAPLIALGTLISEDPGLDLRVQHFHSFNLQGEGGHYHYDVTPQIVEYTAYFSVAEHVYRIDRPIETHSFGRD